MSYKCEEGRGGKQVTEGYRDMSETVMVGGRLID